MSQVETGLLMTPWPAVIIIAAPISGVLSDKVSAGWLGGVGLAALTVGLLLLATLGAHPEPLQIAWRMALCGAGFGIFQSPNNRTMLSAAPRERSGGASGMLGTARLTGQTLGAALVALIFGVAPQNGPIVALYVAAGFSAVAAVVSTMRVMQRVNAQACLRFDPAPCAPTDTEGRGSHHAIRALRASFPIYSTLRRRDSTRACSHDMATGADPARRR